MKKSFLFILGGLVLGFGLLTAFSDESMTPEQKEQWDKVENMLNSKLDSFRMVKDEECKDRALEVAIVRADSIMMASKKTVTTPRKPKPTTKAPPKKQTVEEKSSSKMQGKREEAPTAKEVEEKSSSKMKRGGGN